MGRSERGREREREQRLAQRRAHDQLDGPEALAETLSLRHAAASGSTPDGVVHRAGLEAEMALTPGWQGLRVARPLTALGLGLVALFLLLAVVTFLQRGSPATPPLDPDPDLTASP
jgi:hypothetical protein